jgi:hypothetical protein
MGVLDRWKVTLDELDEIVSDSSSLRGFLFGYISEFKLRKIWFSDERTNGVRKYDNHLRTKKGDISFSVDGVEISVEAKSLQTNSVRTKNNTLRGRFQCDASDRRRVTLPNGQVVETTCLVVGEFDLLAVCLFEFVGDWVFAFAKNADLPRTRSTKYTSEQQGYLLASLVEITCPLNPPFRLEPFSLIEEIVQDKIRMC